MIIVKPIYYASHFLMSQIGRTSFRLATLQTNTTKQRDYYIQPIN